MTPRSERGAAFLRQDDVTFHGELRDYFAGQALTGFLASWTGHDKRPADTFEQLAEKSYQAADAMLEARK